MAAKKIHRKADGGRRDLAETRKLLCPDDHVSGLEAFDDREQDVKDRVHQLVQDRIEFDPGTDCMIYTGAWEEDGKAKMRVGARVYCLSRIVAWLYHDGFQLWGANRAVRTCDSPACCNGEHIRVYADQAAAMSALRRNGKV